MAADVVMPRLSDSMEEGTVLKWLVDVGGEVKRGEPLVEIETDKANMTYESDTSGTLIEVLAKEGDTLPVGEPIARIGEAGEAPSGNGAGKAAPAEKEAEREPEPVAAKAEPETKGEPAARARRAPAAGDGADGRVKASPVARRMARELGVELERVEGSGPGGRIVKADVEAAARGGGGAPGEAAAPAAVPAAPQPAAAQPAGEAGAKGELSVQELTRLQQTVSRRMAESKATAPDFVLEVEVDMSACVELRARLKEVSDPAPSFNDMVVKACAAGLREHPRVNGAYRDGRFELFSRVNVGVAVAAQDALVVPTVFDADRKSLGQIARDARALIEKVREGTVTPPELSGGTFTVSNLGMYGIDVFTAIINPPQAAILTVGSLKKRAVVDDDGRIVARDTMTLTLVCDHRILYGADGARFLARVRELLEQPLALAL
ncbi:MAG: dihydrolipoamide acetyltransferase family protein [Thermoleophilaceae bacterium]